MSSVTRTGHRLSTRRGHRCRAWAEAATTRRPGPPACAGSRRTSPATAAPTITGSAASTAGVLTLPRWLVISAWTSSRWRASPAARQFTLAAAHQLAGRVSAVALIAAGGPIGPTERAGMKPRIRIMKWLARNAPALNAVPVAAMRRAVATPARRERITGREMAAAPGAAHAGLRIELEAVADALGHGPRATVQELALITRPWPFPLSEVSTPVHLWHGARDRNAPIAYARSLARDCRTQPCTSATPPGTMSASTAATRSCLCSPPTSDRAQLVTRTGQRTLPSRALASRSA